jgi:hypothetical protein
LASARSFRAGIARETSYGFAKTTILQCSAHLRGAEVSGAEPL